ncbi:MAG TPA: hypothetical protein ENK06_14050 [Gammaproteobacteria bacterium]|nr:hypothetical protein [Gammaproteobacteria bacterium]
MKSKLLTVLFIIATTFFISGQAMAVQSVNLNGPQWLGHLKLDKKQLKAIKTAFEKALNSPIDAEQQCGKVRLDCVVRAAREWKVDGEIYREMVINLHTIGHASRAVGQSKGKWPKIVSN